MIVKPAPATQEEGQQNSAKIAQESFGKEQYLASSIVKIGHVYDQLSSPVKTNNLLLAYTVALNLSFSKFERGPIVLSTYAKTFLISATDCHFRDCIYQSLKAT